MTLGKNTMTGTAAASGSTLADRITAVERAYEYMLAYAAQGRKRDVEGGVDSGIRAPLEQAHAALAGLATMTVEELSGTGVATFAGFVDVLRNDARKAHSMVGLVLAQPSIGSQLIDNLNASIHLRALLTDLFVISEALKAGN